jgi:glycerol-3-phosphate O-acyltransferase
LDDASVRARAAAVFETVPQANRVVQKEDETKELGRALSGLRARKLIEQSGEEWRIVADQEPVLRFYANSIVHLLPENAASAV